MATHLNVDEARSLVEPIQTIIRRSQWHEETAHLNSRTGAQEQLPNAGILHSRGILILMVGAQAVEAFTATTWMIQKKIVCDEI